MTPITRQVSPTPAATSALDEEPVREMDRTLTLEERLAPVVERSASLVNRSWILRSDSHDLHAEVVDNHTGLVTTQLETRAQERAGDGVEALLTVLTDEGFAWVDIAHLVGVSVPAVRKWRMGGSASPEKLIELARLVAFVDWLGSEKLIHDVASWLEIPLSPSAPISRMQILQTGGQDVLVRSLVGEGLEPEAILDQFEPDWRAHYSSDFEVFTAADGQRSIRQTTTASN